MYLKKIKKHNKVLIILRYLKYSWKYVIIRGEHKNIICMFKNTKESVLISIYSTDLLLDKIISFNNNQEWCMY